MYISKIFFRTKVIMQLDHSHRSL